MALDQPLRTAEFLAVDTETNGLAGDACELTEVGAVLVGGGELHDRWETLLGVQAPLSRGIQRFTGITQAMVDAAPPAAAQLPELAALLEGRVLVAHSAAFDRRVLRQAFARAGLAWPRPAVLCTVALARRLHPLARQRGLRPLAESLGVEVEVSHRALADAETCARVFCALFPRLCANSATVRDALALLRPPRSASGAPRGCGAATHGCGRCSPRWPAAWPPRTPARGSSSPGTRASRGSTRSGWSAAGSPTGRRSAASTTSRRARRRRCAPATAPARRPAWPRTRWPRRGSSPPGCRAARRRRSTSAARRSARRWRRSSTDSARE